MKEWEEFYVFDRVVKCFGTLNAYCGPCRIKKTPFLLLNNRFNIVLRIPKQGFGLREPLLREHELPSSYVPPGYIYVGKS